MSRRRLINTMFTQREQSDILIEETKNKLNAQMGRPRANFDYNRLMFFHYDGINHASSCYRAKLITHEKAMGYVRFQRKLRTEFSTRLP